MAGLTLAQAETALAAWIAADLAVATGPSYTIGGEGGRTLTRANAAEIRTNIDYWEKKINRLSRSNPGPRVRFATPTG
jgi:hypothetical protein